MNPWFETLNKPSWNPPAYLFAPVWTRLYLLMGISLWLIWKSNTPAPQKINLIILFSLQLFLNFWWSIIFFKFHSPALALLNIILMANPDFTHYYKFFKVFKSSSMATCALHCLGIFCNNFKLYHLDFK